MSLFVTERCLIRRLQTVDLPDFSTMQANANVMRYIKPTMDYAESKAELERFISYYDSEVFFYKIWAIVNRYTGTFMGICGVYRNDGKEYEVAYRLRETYWGQGYGREVAEALITYCFDVLELEELTAYVMKDNAGSKNILDQLMVFERESYSASHAAHEYVYKLTKTEWTKK